MCYLCYISHALFGNSWLVLYEVSFIWVCVQVRCAGYVEDMQGYLWMKTRESLSCSYGY